MVVGKYVLPEGQKEWERSERPWETGLKNGLDKPDTQCAINNMNFSYDKDKVLLLG